MARPSTRERMVVSAALLIRERGARATSIDDVLVHSGAPRGSVYHHFPGGRDELLLEATRYAGDVAAGRITAGGGDPFAAFDGLLDAYRGQLLATDFRAGCPVVAVAVEARDGEDDAVRDAAGAAFTHWQGLLGGILREAGVAPERADALALTVISAIEGAIVICRATRDVAALDAVSTHMRALLRAELEETR
jgi:AcrR family transcriptional regulator